MFRKVAVFCGVFFCVLGWDNSLGSGKSPVEPLQSIYITADFIERGEQADQYRYQRIYPQVVELKKLVECDQLIFENIFPPHSHIREVSEMFLHFYFKDSEKPSYTQGLAELKVMGKSIVFPSPLASFDYSKMKSLIQNQDTIVVRFKVHYEIHKNTKEDLYLELVFLAKL